MREIQLAKAKWNVSFNPAREKFFHAFLHIFLCRKEQLSSERQGLPSFFSSRHCVIGSENLRHFLIQ